MFHDLPPAEMQKYREIDPTGDRQQCVATSRNYSMCRSGAWRHIVSSSLSTTCPKSDRVRLPSRSTVQSRVMRDGSNDRRELSIQSDRSRVNSKSSLFGQAGRDMDIYGNRDTAGFTPHSRLLQSLPRDAIGTAGCGVAAGRLLSGSTQGVWFFCRQAEWLVSSGRLRV